MSEKDVPKSCAVLAAQLVVEGCLPIIEGTVKGKAPTSPAPLTQEERARLGLKGQGMTLFYPAGQEGVFFDAGASDFTVWFAGEDVDKATAALHDALLRKFPQTKQLDDVAHPTNRQMRARVYRVELKGGKLAAIKTSFKPARTGAQQFSAHIIAQVRPA